MLNPVTTNNNQGLLDLYQSMQIKAAMPALQMQSDAQQKQLMDKAELETLVQQYNNDPASLNDMAVAYIKQAAPLAGLNIAEGAQADRGGHVGSKMLGAGVGALDSLLFDLIPDKAYVNRYNKGWSSAGKWAATIGSLALGGAGAVKALNGAKGAKSLLGLTKAMSGSLDDAARTAFMSNADELAGVFKMTKPEFVKFVGMSSYDDLTKALSSRMSDLSVVGKEAKAAMTANTKLLKKTENSINNAIYGGQKFNRPALEAGGSQVGGTVADDMSLVGKGGTSTLRETTGQFMDTGERAVGKALTEIPTEYIDDTQRLLTGPTAPGAKPFSFDDFAAQIKEQNNIFGQTRKATAEDIKKLYKLRKEMTGVRKTVGNNIASTVEGTLKEEVVGLKAILKEQRVAVVKDLEDAQRALGKSYSHASITKVKELSSKIEELDSKIKDLSNLGKTAKHLVATQFYAPGMAKGGMENMIGAFTSGSGNRFGKFVAGAGQLSMVAAPALRSTAPMSVQQAAGGSYGILNPLFVPGMQQANMSALPYGGMMPMMPGSGTQQDVQTMQGL